MFSQSNINYSYDGSFYGLLCCIFESYEKKETPCSIIPHDEITLWNIKHIQTDMQKALRVYNSMGKKISPIVKKLVRDVYLTCLEEKEMCILKFLYLAYKDGAKVLNMLTDSRVDTMLKAQQYLKNESHLYLGFVRFAVYNSNMISIIEPKNYVLPVIAHHFCDRYSNENFLIYDKSHFLGLIHTPEKSEIIEIDNFSLPQVESEELKYQNLWKQFYNTIGIKERENSRCRMSHMPKRYWANLTEI